MSMKRVKRQRSTRFYKIQAIGAMVVLGAVSILSLGLTEQQQRVASQQEAKTTAQQAAKVERERLATLKAQELETGNTEQPTEEPTPTNTENPLASLTGKPNANTKPGDVIAVDKNTGAKTFWMGSLSFSQPAITYSLTDKTLVKMTVSTPDSKAVTVPTPVWDKDQPIWLVPQGSDPNAVKATWTLYVDGEDAVAGTYKAYVVATAPSETGDRYEYTGYLTVNIIE